MGVTAEFNLNLLTRINRELSAGFDLKEFRHSARYNASERRIEMHLVSLRNQTVTIPAANCVVQFNSGETIFTESSYKYRVLEIIQIAERASFHAHSQWTDNEWPFAETLANRRAEIVLALGPIASGLFTLQPAATVQSPPLEGTEHDFALTFY